MITQAKGFTYFIGVSGSREGRIGDNIQKLAQVLASREHQVILVIDRQQSDLESQVANPAIYTFPSVIPTKARDLFFLIHLIRRYHPDCIIGFWRAANIMTLAGWLAGVPQRVVWYKTTSNQSVFETSGPTLLIRKFQVLRKKLIYKLATHIITNSQAMKRDLFDIYRIPGSKVDIFSNSRPAPLDEIAKLPKDLNKIVCVGRYSNLKGQMTLIRAMALLKTEFSGLRCDFFGSGETESYQALACELGVDSTCNFHGHASKVLEEMATSAITIVPSKDEAFGYVNIESMSVGTPVIASNVGGIPEVIRDGVEGFLVPSDDPPALASRIRQLLLDPALRTKMGQNGRKRFMLDFEQSESIAKQVDYFESGISK
jgi:glycosyltransferase involved in cell wall biosynthesis